MEGTLFLSVGNEYSFIDIYDEEHYEECKKSYGANALWFYEAEHVLNINDAHDYVMYDIAYFDTEGFHRAVRYMMGKEAKEYYGNKHGAVVYPAINRLYI